MMATARALTERGKVILAEFGYGGKLPPAFPLDLQSRRLAGS
jgi:hypothetical protein